MAIRMPPRLVGGLLLAALALAACGGTTTTTTSTAKVRRGNLTQSVSGSGQVKPTQDINLNFGTAGTIAQVQAREGQRVKQGDRLALLETSDLD
ncbi:MAG TPA: biotin/lipoyl-binding protein, partial [Kouleothrix sp.]|nr:biotin/lipoyl-binding protein [Kouleothrix sp.]